ncbi:NYN domain-containing protein [Corynebacterium sp. ACRQM]|uniref:NYN domain-containing protein n=1 Tax=unclassified Corynebacterium TaxID=2624378 RepID=UPI001EF3EF2E|nr:NYN domain-containing protein [Corynebacterium sp. ACRPR]MCG7233656.1 NYN domain-containing protein [Corynebacterium sp. ACRPR]MCG7243202.1 NYN domain-containing protein [Corynebacterium sp. ACRPS]MCG7271230.1 NYN domain-containing protein [Corynebacterium sp. ACRQM]
MSTYLLVWDAPNMDMGLGSLLGGRPTAAHRPRFDAIGRWLVYRAVGVDADPQAAVFTNVSPGGADVIRPWVEAIRNVGFGVFAKPKIHEDDDVDPDMIDHIEKLRDDLAGVVVASADGQNFQPLLEELIDEGLPVTVLGFHEHASWAVGHPEIEFVDLEDIDGVFREPLPRVNLDNLPEGGAWLQPFRPLAALLNNS